MTIENEKLLNKIAKIQFELDDVVSEWISVKDRLPENVRDVVVCDECGNVFSAYYTTKGWLYAFTMKPCIPHVTHWMPLPDPPKEEHVK